MHWWMLRDLADVTARALFIDNSCKVRAAGKGSEQQKVRMSFQSLRMFRRTWMGWRTGQRGKTHEVQQTRYARFWIWEGNSRHQYRLEAKYLERSFVEKSFGVVVDNNLTTSQQLTCNAKEGQYPSEPLRGSPRVLYFLAVAIIISLSWDIQIYICCSESKAFYLFPWELQEIQRCHS